MAELDKGKPFGEVCGTPHVKYQQGDHYFNAQEQEVDLSGKVLDETPPPAPESTETQTGDETNTENTGNETNGPTVVEPRIEHKGGGHYKVFDHNGEMVSESMPKAEAEAKLEELKQIAAALSDDG